MSKLIILALALCLISSCQATEYLTRSTSSSAATAADVIDTHVITTSCTDITGLGGSSAIYARITANGADWDLDFNCDSAACTGTCSTQASVVVGTPTQINSAGIYYTIATTNPNLTPATKYIQLFNGADCTTAANKVLETTVVPNAGCVANSVDALTYVKVTWDITNARWQYLYGCTTSTCTSCLGGDTAISAAVDTCSTPTSTTVRTKFTATSAAPSSVTNVYLAAYSATTTPTSTTFVSEDAIPRTGACTALTSDSTKYAYARLINADTYTIKTNCNSGCSTCADSVATLATSATTPVTGGATNNYLVAATRQWYTVVAYSGTSCAATTQLDANFIQATTATTTYAAAQNQADVFLNLAYSGSAYTLNYGCESTSACTSGDTIANPTIDGSTCVTPGSSTGYSYVVYAGKHTITAVNLYLNTFSATGATKANYKSQDVLPATGACTALTSTSGKYGKVTYHGTAGKWQVATLCTTNACSTCTEAITAGIDQGASTATQGTTTSNFYTLTTASTGFGNTTTSAATLSVYLFALVALLFAALF